MDRFVLEQKITNCWNLVDDLDLAEDKELAAALKVVYERKFQELWDYFETMVQEDKIK